MLRFFILPLILLLQVEGSKKPNVLLIICDDLNDYLETLGGHPQAKTPHMRRLIERGVSFTQAHCNIPICNPSKDSFITGLHPHDSQLYGFKKWRGNELTKNSRTLTDHFRKNGYHPVVSLDIMATIAARAEAPISTDRPLDGVNLIPFLTGKKGEPPPRAIFLGKFDSGSTAVRSSDYKFVSYNKKGFNGLYDLRDDIGESINIRDKSPEDVTRLKTLWKDWNKSNIDPVFKGLIHTAAWQKKQNQTARKKDRSAPK